MVIGEVDGQVQLELEEARLQREGRRVEEVNCRWHALEMVESDRVQGSFVGKWKHVRVSRAGVD